MPTRSPRSLTPARRIEYLPLAQVKRARRNPKTHDQDAIESSLARFGIGELPLIDARTGLLVAGEGRINTLDLMRTRDRTAPPEGVALADDGDWLVPVITGWTSADDREAEAYLIASNTLSARGGWDTGGLADMLTSMQGNFDGLGYNQADLDDMLISLLPAPPDTPAARHGAPIPGQDAGQGPGQDTDEPAELAGLPEPGAPHHPPRTVWAPMSFPTTAEQCATVQAALDRARLTGYGEAPADALTAVCQFFLDYADDYAAGE